MPDLMQNQEGRFYINMILRGIERPPMWVRTYLRGRDGIQLPVINFVHNGVRYVVATVCRPRGAPDSCASFILNDHDERSTWAYITDRAEGEWIGGLPFPTL